MRSSDNRDGTLTKFADAPCVPIFHSPDLVSWWVIGHPYERLPDWFRFEERE